MLKLAKLQGAPTAIYTSSKSDQSFVDKLRDTTGQPSTIPVAEVRIEKASLFSPEQALKLLQSLQVRDMPESLSSNDRLNYLNTQITLSATQQVCAAGALLAILYAEGHLLAPSQDHSRTSAALYVEEISEIGLDGFLTLDAASMHALQIFQEDRHPSAMGIGQSKEGFSVFGMLNSCVSSMGQRLLRLWFLRPIINLQVLNARQDAIAYFMQAPDLVKLTKDTLRKTRDVPQLLRRLRSTQGLLHVKDFSLILNSVTNLLSLRDIFASLASSQQQPQQVSYPSSYSMQSSQALNAFDSPATPTGTVPLNQSSASWQGSRLHSPSIIQKVLTCIGDELLTCRLPVITVVSVHYAFQMYTVMPCLGQTYEVFPSANSWSVGPGHPMLLAVAG